MDASTYTTNPAYKGIAAFTNAKPKTLPMAPSIYGGANAPKPLSSTVGNVSYNAINPADDLRSKTLSVAPTANRNAIADTSIANWEKQSQPYFQAENRSVTSNGAASGQLGGGQLRTKLGDLALNQGIQHDAAVSGFRTQALNDSVNDAYRDVGVAQQQQARQDSAQNTTFGQNLATLNAGYAGNPSTAQFGAANIASDSAGQSGGALSGLIGNTVAANSAADENTQLKALLARLGIGGGAAPAQAPTPPSTDVPQAGVFY